MCRLRSCCCCDLTVGVYVIAGFTIAATTLGTVALSIGLGGTIANGKYFGLDVHGYEYILIPVMSVGLALFLSWLASAITMVVGNTQKRKSLYIPWMVLASVFVLLIVAGLVYGIFWFSLYVGHDGSFPQKYPAAVIGALCILTMYGVLWTYALIVVGSHYSRLRTNEDMHQPLVQNSPPPYESKGYMA